jgi:hypothetical protein
MDLLETLIQRERIPSSPAKTPPQMDRFITAEKMKAGYANGWQPNPIITRLLGNTK